LPIHPKTSFDIYSKIAATTGNATAHFYLGLFYSVNLGGVLGPGLHLTRQDKAHLHYILAAQGGHTGAEMVLAYRYTTGIGTSVSCNKAAAYYYRVAHKSMYDEHNCRH
jgi:SEL1 protein